MKRILRMISLMLTFVMLLGIAAPVGYTDESDATLMSVSAANAGNTNEDESIDEENSDELTDEKETLSETDGQKQTDVGNAGGG